MSTYNVAASLQFVGANPATLLTLSFGAPAQNDQIVKAAKAALEACELVGGELVLLNGPASLPAACVIAHGVCHKFSAVGVFDPKMSGYVVSIAHGGKYNVGDVIPASEVTTPWTCSSCGAVHTSAAMADGYGCQSSSCSH